MGEYLTCKLVKKISFYQTTKHVLLRDTVITA